MRPTADLVLVILDRNDQYISDRVERELGESPEDFAERVKKAVLNLTTKARK